MRHALFALVAIALLFDQTFFGLMGYYSGKSSIFFWIFLSTFVFGLLAVVLFVIAIGAFGIIKSLIGITKELGLSKDIGRGVSKIAIYKDPIISMGMIIFFLMMSVPSSWLLGRCLRNIFSEIHISYFLGVPFYGLIIGMMNYKVYTMFGYTLPKKVQESEDSLEDHLLE